MTYRKRGPAYYQAMNAEAERFAADRQAERDRIREDQARREAGARQADR
jgi:hypothetical protein